MELATIEKANKLMDEINSLKNMKIQLRDYEIIKKGYKLSQEIIDVGTAAMEAAVDEALDAAQSKLDKL